VAVAVAAVAALDRCALGDGERPGVALVAVGGVVDGELALAGADDGIGKAVSARRAKVGMEEVAPVAIDVGDGGG
jgi:predicted ATP-dependent serine protease